MPVKRALYLKHDADVYLYTRLQGSGRFKWTNGDTYDGTWVRDEMDGNGTTQYANGNKYSGEVISLITVPPTCV